MFNKTSDMQPAPTSQPKPARDPVKTPGVPSQPARDPVKTSGVPSIISRDLKIVGNLTGLGEIEVRGTVEGTIRSRRVIVGESGLVEGSIFAESVRIHGSVRGPVTAISVAVTKTARVIGSITHNELSIEPGAYMKGPRPWRPRPLPD